MKPACIFVCRNKLTERGRQLGLALVSDIRLFARRPHSTALPIVVEWASVEQWERPDSPDRLHFAFAGAYDAAEYERMFGVPAPAPGEMQQIEFAWEPKAVKEAP